MSHVKKLCEFVDEVAGEDSRVFFNPNDYREVFGKYGEWYVRPETDPAKIQDGWVNTTLKGSRIGVSKQVLPGTVIVAPKDLATDELEGFELKSVELLAGLSEKLPIPKGASPHKLPHPEDIWAARNWLRGGAPAILPYGGAGSWDEHTRIHGPRKSMATLLTLIKLLPWLHPIYWQGSEEYCKAYQDLEAQGQRCSGLEACSDPSESVSVDFGRCT